MWYPTLEDVLDVYERIAGAHSPAPELQDEAAVARLVTAPQWVGGEKRTTGAMARKAAAILSCVIEEEPFPKRGTHVGYALAVTFLEKNGFGLQARLGAVRDLAVRLRDGDLGTDALAGWIAMRLERQDRSLNGRRIFAALHHITTVIDRLEKHPDGGRRAEQLEVAGYAICTELVDAFEPSKRTRERILQSYPAVEERWGPLFRDEGPDGEDE